jgi:hypothetical protein
MSALIHVTAWEKASPLRRVIAAFGRVGILFALLFALAFVGYANRYPIAAKIWHWRHGDSVTIGNYIFPVAEHWLIVDQDYAASTMANASPNYSRRDGKFHTTAVITVSAFRESSHDLSKWLSVRRQWLAGEGVQDVEQKTVRFGQESVACIGGSELAKVLRPVKTDVISVHCMSERGLEVMLAGEPSDLESFYTFVSQIRRKR